MVAQLSAYKDTLLPAGRALVIGIDHQAPPILISAHRGIPSLLACDHEDGPRPGRGQPRPSVEEAEGRPELPREALGSLGPKVEDLQCSME